MLNHMVRNHSLSKFQPPFTFNSSQGPSLGSVLIKRSVTLADLPLSTRSQQGLSSIICEEPNNYLAFIFFFVAVMTLWK